MGKYKPDQTWEHTGMGSHQAYEFVCHSSIEPALKIKTQSKNEKYKQRNLIPYNEKNRESHFYTLLNKQG